MGAVHTAGVLEPWYILRAAQILLFFARVPIPKFWTPGQTQCEPYVCPEGTELMNRSICSCNSVPLWFTCCAAEDNGWMTSQRMLGLANVEGCGPYAMSCI